jgi:hypothetical protein
MPLELLRDVLVKVYVQRRVIDFNFQSGGLKVVTWYVICAKFRVRQWCKGTSVCLPQGPAWS